MKYAKYDQTTIYLVSKSKNPNLFPKMRIPRSTTKYWIKTRQHLKLNLQKDFSSAQVNALNEEIRRLKREKLLLKKELHTIKTYVYILNKNKLTKSPDITSRFQIVQTIKNNRGGNSVKRILNSLQISLSTYKRWAKEAPTIYDHEEYIQRNCRSLTCNEVKTLQNLYMEKAFFFYPLHALSTKAKRDKLLYISPRTWQKYIKFLKLQRPVLRNKNKKKYPIGIRANCPHEIWHIDITEFRVKKKKIYMQAIVDNYSRAVLASHVSGSTSGKNTVKLINEAMIRFGPSAKIMSDAGKENINHEVRLYLTKFNTKHIVAKVNTRFSNSIIEVFFRTLKSNYLNHLEIKNKRDLVRKVDYYIENYNNEIPHSALNFRTPEEVLREIPRNYYSELFKSYQKYSLEKRIREFKKK